MARKFKQYIANLGIIVKIVVIKTYHSIDLVKQYHGPQQQVYVIIAKELSEINPKRALQIVFKAINNSVSLNKRVLILLVLIAYPKMIESDAPFSTLIKHVVTMQKAIDEVRKSITSRHVNNAFNTRNGPSTSTLYNLSLNSLVHIF